MLEAGCGVGNCLFPLLEEDLNIFAYACDFSPRAVEYVKVGAPSSYSVTFVFLDLFNLPSIPIWPIPVLSLELTSCDHHICSFPIYIHDINTYRNTTVFRKVEINTIMTLIYLHPNLMIYQHFASFVL